MSLPLGIPFDLSKLPGLQPPPGVLPNFKNPYTRGPLLLGLSAVAIGVMYIFVAARFYTKIRIQRKVTWDDLTCTIATLGITGTFIGMVFLVQDGVGTHQWDVRASVLVQDSFFKPLYILVNFVPLVALFTKLSFFIYFLQIFKPERVLRRSIYVGAFVTTAFYVATTVALFVLSTPKPGGSFAQQFASFVGKTTSPVLDVTLVVGYFNVFSDVFILVLPISGVMKLKLARRRKIGVILIFMTGLLAVAASSAALYYRYQNNKTGDSTWNLMPAAYLVILEITVGIDCSCMPACALLVRHYFPVYVSLKSQVSSRVHKITARLAPRGRNSADGSRSRGFFSLGDSKNSSNVKQVESDGKGGHVVVMKKLPEIKKGVHKMRTARSFIWGSKHYATTVDEDEEKDGIYYAQNFQQSVDNV